MPGRSRAPRAPFLRAAVASAGFGSTPLGGLGPVRSLHRDVAEPSIQPGMYHVFSRSSVKNAGTSVMRHDQRVHEDRHREEDPNSFETRSVLRMKAEKTVPMMIAAATTTWPMAAMPCSIASRVCRPWTCSSRMRTIRKTM